jgi:hypothetical protein
MGGMEMKPVTGSSQSLSDAAAVRVRSGNMGDHGVSATVPPSGTVVTRVNTEVQHKRDVAAQTKSSWSIDSIKASFKSIPGKLSALIERISVAFREATGSLSPFAANALSQIASYKAGDDREALHKAIGNVLRKATQLPSHATKAELQEVLGKFLNKVGAKSVDFIEYIRNPETEITPATRRPQMLCLALQELRILQPESVKLAEIESSVYGALYKGVKQNKADPATTSYLISNIPRFKEFVLEKESTLLSENIDKFKKEIKNHKKILENDHASPAMKAFAMERIKNAKEQLYPQLQAGVDLLSKLFPQLRDQLIKGLVEELGVDFATVIEDAVLHKHSSLQWLNAWANSSPPSKAR